MKRAKQGPPSTSKSQRDAETEISHCYFICEHVYIFIRYMIVLDGEPYRGHNSVQVVSMHLYHSNF